MFKINKMKTLLTVFLLLQVCFLQAQTALDLQKCRSMALENSKKMAIAGQQALKANYDKKVYRANFFPKISAMGMYAYMQKDYSFIIPKGRGNGASEFLAVLFRRKKIPAGNPAGRAAHNGRLRPSFSFTGRSNCVKRRLVVDAAC